MEPILTEPFVYPEDTLERLQRLATIVPSQGSIVTDETFEDRYANIALGEGVR